MITTLAIAERLLIVAPDQTRRKALDAVNEFAAGDLLLLTYEFMLSRADLQSCPASTSFDGRLAFLNTLLDRMGVPSYPFAQT